MFQNGWKIVGIQVKFPKYSECNTMKKHGELLRQVKGILETL